MRIIEQLVYKIQGDNSEFDRSIDKSETKVSKFGSVADKMLAGVTVAAIGMVIKKIGDMVVSSATALDRVDKLSQKIGISRVAFQEWDYILGQSGASVEGLQMGVKTLSNAADEARKGTALYAEAFDRLGVSVTDANGNMKDQEALFAEVFSSLADMENQTERTAIATKLLGRSATELAPTLNTSKEAIEGLRQEAHDLGLVYSDELVDAGVVLGDNIDRLKKSFEAFKTNALAPIIGLAVTFTDKLLGHKKQISELEKETRDLTSQNIQYKSTLSQLLDPTIELTDVERARLIVLKGLQSATLESTILSTASAYEKDAESIKNATLRLEERRIEEAAFALVVNNRAEALRSVEQLEKKLNITDRESVELGRLREALSLDGIELFTRFEKVTLNASDAQAELNNLTESYNVALRDIAIIVRDGSVNIDKYAITNKEFYNSIINIVHELDLEEQALDKAKEGYREFENASNDVLDGQIKLLQQYGKTREAQLLLGMLLDLQNKRLSEAAILTDSLAEKEKLRNEIVKNTNDALAATDVLESVLGEQYDQNAEKISIVTNALKSLVESGLDPTDDRIILLQSQLSSLIKVVDESNEISKAYNLSLKKLGNELLVTGDQQKFWESVVSLTEQTMVELLGVTDANSNAYIQLANSLSIAKSELAKLNDELSENTNFIPDAQKAFDDWVTARNKAITDAFNDETKTRADGYSLMARLSASDRDRQVFDIQAQAQAFLEAGVDRVDVATWQSEQIQNLMQSDADKAEEEAERARKAWEDYAFGVAGSIASMWRSINQARENANAQELQDLEELHDTRIQDAKAAGATEEELVQLQKTLADELNAKKTELAREDLERQKQVAIFSVVLDTAKAIMQIWSDATAGGVIGKSIWTGIAAGAGVAQIAAINSQPMPSFDVGSIRIPETTQAIVHKDEMILTAPQAEQARREGITISPSGGGGGNYTFMIYLDGRQISDATVKNINSGMYKIDARVVK